MALSSGRREAKVEAGDAVPAGAFLVDSVSRASPGGRVKPLGPLYRSQPVGEAPSSGCHHL
jgi:hypothetical protein